MPRPLFRLLRLGRPYLPALAVATACCWLVAAADLGLLRGFQRLVDRLLADASGRPAVSLVLGLLGLVLAREAAAGLAALLQTRVTSRFVRDLQDRLYAHLHRLPLTFFDRSAPGDLVSRLIWDAGAAASLIGEGSVVVAESLVRLAVLFAAALLLHPTLAAGSALVLLPGLVGARLLGRRLRRRLRGLSEDIGRLHERAYETLAGAELVQSFVREADEAAEFRQRNAALAERQEGVARAQALVAPGAQLVKLTGLAFGVAYGAGEVAAGRLTPGGLAAILVALYAFLGAAQALLGVYSAAQAGLASADRLFAVLDEPPGLVAPPRPRPARFESALRFEGVSFGYPGRGHVLRGLDLTLRPGERVAIAGRSGAGKTTLLRLALRLHDPLAGRVTLDGVDLRELDPAELRGLFAVVPQEGAVFDRTLRENLLFARNGASDAELARALALAGLSPLIAALPQGLDTLLGSRGVCLSGGERQRLSLARAVLRDAPIVLLDEATSALDGEAEARVRAALAEPNAGRTTLTISHRLSTLRSATRVVVLDEGRVAQDAPHEALLRVSGPYRRLFEEQILGVPAEK
jgi:ATP-binding cassette, subfamily B, bacterial